jgi:flagellar biosynthesis protein FlhA
MIFPLPAFMMDVLLIINISISLMVLLFSLYIHETLEFSVFPTLLLFITLFRLALNLSSTRLILGNSGDAGQVIKTFGNVVIGGNLVVGVVVFLIIMVIQFLVITKGAERVAEVAARFTLDAMPGKQMAIDADLNSGIIDENQARERRAAIQAEADFNAAMDGASKFVKGDAIAGVIITLINIIGGLIIGYTTGVASPVRTFTLATIGDGLVSQIPALLVSTASGIIVTRSGSGNTSFGEEVSGQITSQPNVIMMAGILLAVVALIPGLPKPLMWLYAAVLIAVGIMIRSRGKRADAQLAEAESERRSQERRKPESVLDSIAVELFELNVGYGLIPLIDESRGGDLVKRLGMVRRQCALDPGILMPAFHLRDHMNLGANAYSILIKGVEVAHGEVMADYLLALNTGDVEGEISGIQTVDPTFGTPALWIPKSERENAELFGYTTVDPPSVITTHLTEVIKRHAHELLTRQQVQQLVDNVKRTQPALVDEVIPKMFSLGELQKVLAGLLEEDIPIRDIATILETLGDFGNLTRDPETLIEYVRVALKRMISKRFAPDGKAHVLTLDPELEQAIADATKQTERGSYLAMEPTALQNVFNRFKALVESVTNRGNSPIVLTSPVVRKQFRKISEQLSPDIVVMSYNELEPDVDVFAEGVVKL